MSINAIGSIVPIYEYYYKIDKKEKTKSPLADELEKYGIKPSEDEAINAAMLKKAKEREIPQTQNAEIPSNRPWADLMYQLNLEFNPNPKDDILDIKDEISKLTQDMDDEELKQEISDLENYAEKLYLDYSANNQTSFNSSTLLSAQLNNISVLNQAML